MYKISGKIRGILHWKPLFDLQFNHIYTSWTIIEKCLCTFFPPGNNVSIPGKMDVHIYVRVHEQLELKKKFRRGSYGPHTRTQLISKVSQHNGVRIQYYKQIYTYTTIHE